LKATEGTSEKAHNIKHFAQNNEGNSDGVFFLIKKISKAFSVKITVYECL
jgi:hypothetical protein